MEKDLEILEKILRDQNYATEYISMILQHLVKELGQSSLERFTPNFIYSALAFELGRAKSKEIAEYFEEFKSKGSYRTSLQKAIEDSPSFSKYTK
jgi:lipopolysaccharide biosynthesis regulator YciM